eukprot:gene1075-1361_t
MDSGVKLRDAAKSGDVENVKKLVKEGPKVVNYTDRTGFTPLHMASMFGHKDICTILLENGADKTIVSVDGETASDVAKETHASIAFDIFELLAIISYYCMYDIVLFSWVEVVFRVRHLGYGEEKVHFWRNVFCFFTGIWVLTIFIISDLFLNVDTAMAVKVFGIGLITISVFSFCLSLAFFVYWIKLHRMIMSIQNSTNANRGKFLWKAPFSSDLWDLYALNYLPEAIAVTVALLFFGSKMSASVSNSNSSKSMHTETEKANLARREQKQYLLSVNTDNSSSSQ